MPDVPLMIGEHDLLATGNGTFERRNPVTGDVATRAAAATVVDAIAAADAAAAAFPAWSTLGPNARRGFLLKAADLLAAKAPEFIRLMAEKIGAIAAWAGFNAHLAASMLREAAATMTQITGEVTPRTSRAAFRWRCASRSTWCSAWRPRTRPSSSTCARSPCRSPAATRSC